METKLYIGPAAQLPPAPQGSGVPPMEKELGSGGSGMETRNDFTPEMLTVRATTVTVTLKEMLQLRGYRHGGLND